jgi:hypothetical protein
MDFEKLGAFYLGKEPETDEEPERLVMYDARDLTTHAVCIGMTGSGKTGLCVDLLEEAALDRVPAIIIDPKGDITNLLLSFPDLRPEDFRPWVNADDARRKGLDLDAFAAGQAQLWRKGLASWGQDGERIRALRETTDFSIYTPGSDAGIPVSMLSSFAAPRTDWSTEAEYLRERIEGTVTGLLGLIGVKADPVQSREHILLSNLFEHFWRAGCDLDITSLILSIQEPPVRQLGVFDVDTFFPAKDRIGLAMKLNNLIASPGFQSWLQGQPLDIGAFLTAPDGRPRHSIFYIAHLSEAERMFFVTMLLNQVVTWLRAQPGTTSLRALLYMDEVFGFLPPVAEPPSKKPFLTLFKQARAYGLGVVLTTQNPVDLDYKAITNAGTWFIGRLQTERDKMRVLEGLEAASAESGQSLSRKQADRLISGLGKRVFLLHNVHEEAPITFKTRWAMSYLRGPLTRGQVGELMEGRGPDPVATRDAAAATADSPAARAAGAAGTSPTSAGTRISEATPASRQTVAAAAPPALDPEIEQFFVPLLQGPTAAALEVENRHGPSVKVGGTELVYQPRLLGAGRVHFLHRKSGTEAAEEFALLAGPDERGAVRWDEAAQMGGSVDEWPSGPEDSSQFASIPADINDVRDVRRAAKDLSDYLYRSQSITLYHSPDVDEFSTPGESVEDFRLRLRQVAREKRDAAVDKLEDKYGKRMARLEERVRKAQSTVSKHEADAEARKRETLVSVGESVLGMFLGRRSTRAVSSTLRKQRMSSSAKMRAEQAEENLAALQQEMAELEEELRAETADITDRWDHTSLELAEVKVTPRRADVDVATTALAWAPLWRVTFDTPGGETSRDDVPAY